MKLSVCLTGLALVLGLSVGAQDYKMKTEVSLPATVVKSQGHTGTCWSFSTHSFLESEILRIKGDTLDLSEIFAVRAIYWQKALRFANEKGKSNHSEGGLSHDVFWAVEHFGMMPESAYSGLTGACTVHNHSELIAMLNACLKNGDLKSGSGNWPAMYESVLDTYLGSCPNVFFWKGKWYTPQSFAAAEGIDVHNYVELTSFTNAAPYEKFALDIPDNWNHSKTYYNLSLDELVEAMVDALKAGYTFTWDGDVSEEEFNQDLGLAIWPNVEWSAKTEEQRKKTGVVYEPEMKVTPKIRQQYFETKKTTDDHLMHVVGLATDARGTRYFITKNSWGEKGNYAGYVYLSEAYVRAKTISVALHKDALPKSLAKKLFKAE